MSIVEFMSYVKVKLYNNSIKLEREKQVYYHKVLRLYRKCYNFISRLFVII